MKALFKLLIELLHWSALFFLFLLIFGQLEETTETIKYDNSILQYESVLDSMGVAFPKVAMCQNLHETGIFKSKVFKENHNPFGMKESSRTFDAGTKNGHAYYPHKAHPGKCVFPDCYVPAIKDYIAWQNAFHVRERCKTDEDYIYYLQHLPGGRKYATDPRYEEHIWRYYSTLFIN